MLSMHRESSVCFFKSSWRLVAWLSNFLAVYLALYMSHDITNRTIDSIKGFFWSLTFHFQALLISHEYLEEPTYKRSFALSSCEAFCSKLPTHQT